MNDLKHEGISTELQPAVDTKQITHGTSPTEVALQALSMGYGKEALEVLQGMSELQLKHDAEKAKREFAIDMAACQSEMPVVPERGRNSQTGNSKYAKLKDAVLFAKPIYTKFGFSISFYEEDSPKENHVRWCADVMHKSGHMVSRHVDVPLDDKGIKGTVNKTATHAMKSSSTYGRGILICHIFNIPTGDDIDDDGNAAGGIETISNDQVVEINDMIKSLYGEDESLIAKCLNFMRIESVEKMPAKDYKRHLAGLKDMLSKKRGK